MDELDAFGWMDGELTDLGSSGVKLGRHAIGLEATLARVSLYQCRGPYKPLGALGKA